MRASPRGSTHPAAHDLSYCGSTEPSYKSCRGEDKVATLAFLVPRTGIEPVWPIGPTDFKSVASTNSATWANDWRLGSESNRRPRLCRPLHDHSAT